VNTFVVNASPLIVLAKAGLLETVLGLHVTGTIGLLLMAKKVGHIRTIAPALDAVVAAGLFISERHLAEVRRRAGE
jgi:predicted nucleic acid-binding protein